MILRLYIFLCIICVSSCSAINSKKCQINGNVEYLKTSELRHISIPDDFDGTLNMSKKYLIPDVSNDKALKVGKDLDICPPKVIE